MMIKPHDYRSIIQRSPDLYLIFTPDLTIIEASDAYLEATMVTREEILGRALFDVFPANPEEPAETGTKNLALSIQAVLEQKLPHAMQIQKYDIRCPASEGGAFVERYWLPLNIPVLNERQEVGYIIHRVEDVTEMITLREKSIENDQRLQLLVENIKDYSIMMLDTEGIIVSWNSGAEYMTGYTAKEAIGKSAAIFYIPETEAVQHFQYELQVAREQDRYEEEGWRVRKDGSTFWANIVLIPIYDAEKKLIGYGKVTRDLTAKKKIERLKNEFISVVNHELRTPLTSIVGSIRLLQEEATQKTIKKTKQLLEIADCNCNRLMRLINDMLDIERLEAENINFECEPRELNSLISEAIFLNQVYADKYGIKIVWSPVSATLKVNTDSDRLIQVLTNLLSNAVKFSYKNSPVTIQIEKLQNTVRVSIINNGDGIPEDFKERIFRKFSQGNASINRNKEGTGLGLAISKKIIEGLGGSLHFNSVPQKKTTFYFELPLFIERDCA